MQLHCPHCQAVLEFSDKRPSFCGYCGQSLGVPRPVAPTTTLPAPAPAAAATVDFDAEGVTLPPPAHVPPTPGGDDPQTVGGYQLLRVLGQGGMGKVYEAEDAAGRRVALKLISSEYATSKETVERFRQEGRLASLVTHPRCVFVIAADEEAGRPYIVMELMPGHTLQDLLRERGPLPPQEAVCKILDVIDGLEEAHRLGVVHRDIKPSNCFLDRDGRVKIGDFGLSKSLVGTSHLTRTGAFMGTPLYSSPEQIRAEKVDQQTDIYAVAATLYCLLVGRAPFQGGDAAATLARIVTDDPPSLRSIRPELPPALDKVVLKGLERDRADRWRSLAELREALRPFAGEPSKPAGPGVRALAYLIDCALFLPLWIGFDFVPKPTWLPRWIINATWDSFALPWIAYLVVLEGVWGWTLGKLVLRLRVARATGTEPPGVPRALVRAGVFYLLVSLAWTFAFNNQEPTGLQVLLALSLLVLGAAAVAGSMRRKTGFRGLHELASGTRTLRLPWTKAVRQLGPGHVEMPLARPPTCPERVGTYAVKGALRWDDDDRLLAGEDVALHRRVWLWLRPESAPPLADARRGVTRPTRPRWLACGEHEGWQWDAFLAPAGCPLADVVRTGGRLTWLEFQPLLDQLIEEVAAASRDGSLPQRLTATQVWVRPNGQVQLLDLPLCETNPKEEITEEQRTLSFLADTTILALEGAEKQRDQVQAAPRKQTTAPRVVQAPLPGRVAPVLRRLLCSTASGYANVGAFQTDLAALHEHPPEVTAPQRLFHSLLVAALLIVPLFILYCVPHFAAAFLKASVCTDAAKALRENQRRLARFEAGIRGEFLMAAFGGDPFGPARAIRQAELDGYLHEVLQRRRDEKREQLDSLIERSGWFTKNVMLDALNEDAETYEGYQPVGDFRSGAILGADDNLAYWTELMWPAQRRGVWIILGTISVSLVAWAVLTRGGVALVLAGLSLRSADGRKAPRWRCGVRALLVWAPVAVQLAVVWALHAVLVERWLTGERGGWAAALMWVCWWGALMLLPLYAGLGMRFPSRPPHDRLAGTYVVPR